MKEGGRYEQEKQNPCLSFARQHALLLPPSTPNSMRWCEGKEKRGVNPGLLLFWAFFSTGCYLVDSSDVELPEYTILPCHYHLK